MKRKPIKNQLASGAKFQIHANPNYTYFLTKDDDCQWYSLHSLDRIYIGLVDLSYKRFTISATVHGIYMTTVVRYDDVKII